MIARTPPDAIVVAPWLYATTLAYAAYVLHRDFGPRIVVTAGAAPVREPRTEAGWRTRPLVIVSDDPLASSAAATRELDHGSPHLYALR